MDLGEKIEVIEVEEPPSIPDAVPEAEPDEAPVNVPEPEKVGAE